MVPSDWSCQWAAPGLCWGCFKPLFPLGAFLGTVWLRRCSNLADVAAGCTQCLPHLSPPSLFHWWHKPVQSQAASGHIALWPLGRGGLRRFPKISLRRVRRELVWMETPGSDTGLCHVCPQRLLLAFVPQSIFIQCILISKYYAL